MSFELIIPFGKKEHQKTLKEIMDDDIDYSIWLLNKKLVSFWKEECLCVADEHEQVVSTQLK